MQLQDQSQHSVLCRLLPPLLLLLLAAFFSLDRRASQLTYKPNINAWIPRSQHVFFSLLIPSVIFALFISPPPSLGVTHNLWAH